MYCLHIYPEIRTMAKLCIYFFSFGLEIRHARNHLQIGNSQNGITVYLGKQINYIVVWFQKIFRKWFQKM